MQGPDNYVDIDKDGTMVLAKPVVNVDGQLYGIEDTRMILEESINPCRYRVEAVPVSPLGIPGVFLEYGPGELSPSAFSDDGT